MAKCSRVPIVPMCFEYVGEECYVKYGNPFSVNEDEEKAEVINRLRDMLATLKWDIFEYIKETREDGYIVRSELRENYWLDYLYDRISEWPITDLEEEMKYVFQPKGVYEAEEVFAPIRRLEPKKENAFLWRK